MKLVQNTIIAVLGGLFFLSAHATAEGASGVLDPLNPCTASNWQITGAMPSSFYTGTLASVGPIDATSCAGVYLGNDGPALNPSPNLGYLNDGLLNGQFGLLSPTQFISSSQLQALKDSKNSEDPGWVMLGSMDNPVQTNGTSATLKTASVTPAGGSAFDLGSVIKYTQTRTSDIGGTWLLEVDKNIKSILEAQGLFSRSNFDQLAFEVKSSTSWAVYDFDFTKFSGFDLTIPYTIAGTWTMNGDFEQACRTDKDGVVTCSGIDQNISHMSVWARDPVSGGTIPEPGSLALIGLALAGLTVARRRK